MMQLFVSDASPFARKCRALVREKGALAAIEEVTAPPMDDPKALIAANPNAQVPALTRPGAPALTDSAVIAEYLDTILDGPALFPREGEARWEALRLQALGDNAMDAAVKLRQELSRPESEQSSLWKERWTRALARTMDALEAAPPAGPFDIGPLTIACLLEYIDFRHPEMDWRASRPKLSAWAEEASTRPSMVETQPA